MRVEGHPVVHSKSLSSENFSGIKLKIKIKTKQQRVPTEGWRDGWWLGALAALAEDLIWFPASTWQFTIVSNSGSRDSASSFWPPQELYTSSAHT